jgi:hypothetical protein
MSGLATAVGSQSLEQANTPCWEPGTINKRGCFNALAWTLKSRWQKQDQLLREVTGNFHSEK